MANEDEGGNDIVVENEVILTFTLFKVASTGENQFALERINAVGKDINKDMIQYGTTNVYLLDSPTEVYVWEANKAEKSAKTFAKNKLKEILDSRPAWTLSETFKEEQEGILFRSKFADWPEPGKIAALKERQAVQKRAARRQYDVTQMFTQEKGGSKKKKAEFGWADTHAQATAEKDDDGKGSLTVFIVRDSKLTQQDSKTYGYFFASETYVLRYNWEFKGKKRGIYYVWQGRTCIGNKKGAGALLMNEMCRAATVAGDYYEDPEHVSVSSPSAFHCCQLMFHLLCDV